MLNDTIVAIATPQGEGALGIIRLSGSKSFTLIEEIFFPKSKLNISEQAPNTIHFGEIKENDYLIDEVLVSIFKSPKSYTGEDLIEISCHGSQYILNKILQLLIEKGARLANAGEFTLRAFLNGKLDLSQAESVADLISSEDQASHRIAIQQMRGGYSKEIFKLREELINFTSLIELELDFSEEDVEFADRNQIKELLSKIKATLKDLLESFKLGNSIKQGIPVTIIGQPNAGKSSILNLILNESKSIVSHIEGTTRDIVEDVIILKGRKFRFLDTAGIRDTQNEIEIMGIEKSFESAKKSDIILYVIDIDKKSFERDYTYIDHLKKQNPHARIILIFNKIDLLKDSQIDLGLFGTDNNNIIKISAKNNVGIDSIKEKLIAIIDQNKITSSIIISNARHYQHFLGALETLEKVEQGINDELSGDLLSIDIKEALYHLGQITGDIDIDTDILGTIFGKFCIGK